MLSNLRLYKIVQKDGCQSDIGKATVSVHSTQVSFVAAEEE